jgi:hypothetical protein
MFILQLAASSFRKSGEDQRDYPESIKIVPAKPIKAATRRDAEDAGK